jgi:hypothetical protein
VLLATSLECGLECIEGLVALQPLRSVVFDPLKDWLLRNLLGALSYLELNSALQYIGLASMEKVVNITMILGSLFKKF